MKRWQEGMDLAAYAAAWEDMAPHVQQLVDLATPCRRILELGVRGGVSTAAFLTGLPPYGELWSIDIDPNVPDMVPPWVRNDHRWRFTCMNSKDIFPSVDAYDLALIDTSHTYADTIVELRHLLLGAKIIVLHDYLDPNYPGVHEAIHEVLREGGLVMTVHPSRWGLAVLEREPHDA